MTRDKVFIDKTQPLTYLEMDLTTAFSNLETAINDGSTWTPVVLLPSTHCTTIDNDIVFNSVSMMPAKPSSSHVDIVKLLSPSFVQETAASSILKYPKGAIFEIEGYVGTVDYEKVATHVKRAAQSGGSALSVTGRKKNPSKRYVPLCYYPYYPYVLMLF